MYWGRPVIRREYLALRWRLVVFACYTLAVAFATFMFGVYVGMTDPAPAEDVVIQGVLPEIEERPYVEPAIEDGPATFQYANWTPEDYEKEINCMAMNIYFEARNESTQGQIAVALVTINRVLSEAYPGTVCEVVWEQRRSPKYKKMVAQFSWTLDGKPDRIENKRKWNNEILPLARAMLAEGSLLNFSDFTQGATHYHADYVDPWWNKKFTPIMKVDTHLFYRDEKVTPFIRASADGEAVAMKDQLDV